RHGWTKRGKLPGDVPPRHQTKNPHHNGTWQGGDQLRKTPGTDHREDQDGREDEQGQPRAHTHSPHPDRLPSSARSLMHATGLEACSVRPCVHLDEPLPASAEPLVTRSVAGGAATELGRIPARSSHVSQTRP